jgi:hypothetical protein
VSMTEDERAALWRQQTTNRIEFKTNLWLSLQAPPEPRQQVLDDWEAFIMFIAQQEAGWQDPALDP